MLGSFLLTVLVGKIAIGLFGVVWEWLLTEFMPWLDDSICDQFARLVRWCRRTH
jgi:hypothetical protein